MTGKYNTTISIRDCGDTNNGKCRFKWGCLWERLQWQESKNAAAQNSFGVAQNDLGAAHNDCGAAHNDCGGCKKGKSTPPNTLTNLQKPLE